MKSSPKVAILQSCYIPWKGYFDIIHDVDIFVFLDDTQFTNRDWRTRNKIKTPQGAQWITIPVGSNRDKKIEEVLLPQDGWAEKHWKQISQNYSKAPFFKVYEEQLKPFWMSALPATLSEFNQTMTIRIAREILGLKTEFRRSNEFPGVAKKHDRLLEIVKAVGGKSYLSGPSARNYIPEGFFEAAGIELSYKDYGPYPEYDQPYPPFDHAVTVLDLLFQEGEKAPQFIWNLK